MSSNFTQTNLAISLPYSAEVGIGSSNTLFTGQGNLYVGSNLTVGTIAGGSNGPAATFLGPATGQYRLTLPSTSNGSTLPYVQNSLTISQTGQCSFTPAEFTAVNASLSNGAPPTLLTQTQLETFITVTGTNGLVTIYPTSTGTSSGTPLFANKILSVQGLVWANALTLNTATILTGVSMSTTQIQLLATQSTGIILGGSAINYSPSGLTVTVTVIGY